VSAFGDIVIRPAAAADATAIAVIYNHYVRESIATFEEDPVNDGEIARRISDVQRSSLPWLVAERDDSVIGYAYAVPWRGRSAYRFSAEITSYLAPDQTGRGIGAQLYTRLFQILEERGLHAVLGGISLPNPASVALHEKFGMRKVAHFSEVGFKFGHWIDVGFWERLLAKREIPDSI
jgi:L-amino acid N-acyltransferase YncA